MGGGDVHMCSCLVTTLAGAELFDSWMCLTAGAVACRLYVLDKLNHMRPLVIGLSNMNKPRLSLLFFINPFFFFVQREGVVTCHPS